MPTHESGETGLSFYNALDHPRFFIPASRRNIFARPQRNLARRRHAFHQTYIHIIFLPAFLNFLNN
jgi:hypothetical protein